MKSTTMWHFPIARLLGVTLLVLSLTFILSCRGTAPKVIVERVPQTVEFSANSKVDRIPLQATKAGIFVPVSINGKPPIQMELDTGAAKSALTVDDAQRLGLQRITGPEAFVMVGRQKTHVEPYYARTFQVGETLFRDCLFVSTPAARSGPSGHLGFMAFAKTVFTIDLQNQVLEIAHPHEFRDQDWMPCDVSLGVPVVHFALIDPQTGTKTLEIDAIIDTGAKSSGGAILLMPNGFSLSESGLAAHTRLVDAAAAGHTPLSRQSWAIYSIDYDLQLGPHTVSDFGIAIETSGNFAWNEHAVLSLPFFESLKITFDISNNRWALNP